MAVRLIESFLDAVDRDPEGIVVREGRDGPTWSRSRILQTASRLAQRLEDEVGRPGTVMLHGPSGGGFWAGLLAGFATGRSVLPVGSESTDRERAALAAAHPLAAVIETSPIDSWGSRPSGTTVVGIDSDPRTAVRDLPRRASNCRLLLRSSGTTDRPAVAVRNAAAIDRVASVLVDRLSLDAEDEIHVALPMQHAYGMEHGVLAPIMAGSRIGWSKGLDPLQASDAVSNGATVLPTVPAILDGLARESNADSGLRLVYTAGSPLPRTTATRFLETWGIDPGDLYGMTEVGTIAYGTGGRIAPVDGVDVRILGPDGAVVRSGEGEILVRSDAMFDGYVVDDGNVPDPGRRIDGLLRTGDLGDVDASGTIRITGRAKVQFDVGGLEVNPEEIEAVLREDPDVVDAAVAPLRLSETVTRVQAFVVWRDGIDRDRATDALRSRTQEELAVHQRPRSIEAVASLPRTATGKLRRGMLESV